ncbi:MAG: hypothetical protein ACPG4N_02730 [Gammaproteobacteria bacterium]
MSLSDPFCRVEKRREKGYAAFRKTMLENDVNTLESAQQVRQRMRNYGLKGAAVVIAVCAAIALIFPNAAQFTLVLGVIALIWLAAVAFISQIHMGRFMREQWPEKD